MWVLNIHGSVCSVPLKKYLSWWQPLGQECCPLCLWGWCNSCRLLSPAGCCAGAILCSPTAFPGRETRAWRGGALCFFCFWGWQGGALRVTVWQSCPPWVSCITEHSCCNLLIILHIALCAAGHLRSQWFSSDSGPAPLPHRPCVGGWMHPLQWCAAP